mmetsp:Transcript_25569/g.31489  ORF Transcript_25569/g.31489 Transcript_25569/m.31489 type:complete len:265 (+) Transcript_25569:152-946(+)
MTASNQTLLQSPFCFWYMRRGKGANAPTKVEEESKDNKETNSTNTVTIASTNPSNPYENSIKQIAKVSTVEEFWSIYNHLNRPNELPTTTDYHFFRDGIKPTWEDPSNAKGGKWIVRLRKGLASRYWEEIVLALIGCQFTGLPHSEVCGAVVSIRYSEDIVSVWNKTATDREVTERLRDCIKKILQLPNFVHMEYKPHETSLQDKSSFRNTQVWKPKSTADSSSNDRGTRRNSNSTGMPRSGSWGSRDEFRSEGGNKSWRNASH